MTKFGGGWWFHSVLAAMLVISGRSATDPGLTAMTTANSEESVGVDRSNDTTHSENNTQTDKNTEMATIPYSQSSAEGPLGAEEGKSANESKDNTQGGKAREEQSTNPYVADQAHGMMDPSGSESHNNMATELPSEELLSLGTVDGLAMTPLRWQCGISVTGKSHGFHFKVYCYCDALCHVFNDCCLGASNSCNISMDDRSTPLQITTQLDNTSTPDDAINISATNVEQNASKSSNFYVNNEGDFNVSSGKNDTEVGTDVNQASPRSLNVKPASISLPQKKAKSQFLADTASLIANKLSCYTPGFINDIPDDTKGPVLHIGRYWMVDQCPDEWTDDVVRKLCSTAYTNINTQRDVAINQPVTDQSTSIAYKNKFCALCHGVELGKKWELYVRCWYTSVLDLLECRSFDCAIEKIRQNAYNCNGHFKDDLRSRSLLCFPDLTDSEYPDCTFAIVEGRVTWSNYKHDTPLKNACKAYTNPVQLASTNALYKNYHCLVCYSGLKHIGCRENPATDPTKQLQLDVFSFSAFLYTGAIKKKQEADGIQDLASGLVCPPGFLADGQTCQPVLYNFTQANYLLILEFEPLGWSPSDPFQCQILRRLIEVKPMGAVTHPSLQLCEIKNDPVTGNVTVTLKTPVTFIEVLTDYGQGLKELACIQSFFENKLKSKIFSLPEGRLRVRPSSQDTKHCPRRADEDDGKADGDRKIEKRPAQTKSRGLVIASEILLIMPMFLLCRVVIWEWHSVTKST